MEIRSLKCWLFGHIWKGIKPDETSDKGKRPRRKCIVCGSVDVMERRGLITCWFPMKEKDNE